MQTAEKWATRSDAWTPDDDKRLANLVLKHIRTGGTQLKAFEEAANLLGRTSAACGYRWNGVVRKHYKQEIELAKQARKNKNASPSDTEPAATATASTTTPETTLSTSESIKDVIDFLQTYDAGYQKLRNYVAEVEQEKQTLLARIEELESQLKSQQDESEKAVNSKQLEEDSRTLFAIMERARKLLGDSGRSQSES